MKQRCSTKFQTMISAFVLQVSGAILGVAGASAQLLPPPPSVGNPSTLPPPASSPFPPSSPLPTQPPSNPFPNDRVFEAPRSSGPATSFRGYRVFVLSDSPYVLQQVRFLEPGAFFQNFEGRRVIQAGIFSNEANAQQQANFLRRQGVETRIVNESGSFGNALRGYYAIVPASREELVRLRDRAVQSGVPFAVIRLRERPLGPHMAVGPYSNPRDAETLSNYLRQRANLDSRVFYNP